MKKNALGLACVLAALSLRADVSSPSAPPVTVNVNSEAKDLAHGYAQGSAQLSRPPITLAIQKEHNVLVIEDVKSVKAADGVLILEVGRGLIYMINPKDVLYITDGPQLKPKS